MEVGGDAEKGKRASEAAEKVKFLQVRMCGFGKGALPCKEMGSGSPLQIPGVQGKGGRVKCIYPDSPIPILRVPLLPRQAPDLGLCWESNLLSTSVILTIKSSSCRR